MTIAYASGDFVAEHLEDKETGEPIPDSRIQPNGVDLTIDTLYRTSGKTKLTSGGYSKPDRTELSHGYLDNNQYRLPTGPYIIVYGERITIPDGYVGRVYPRSRLMRCGITLESALWDQGYSGVGEGLLKVPRSLHRAKLSADMAVAQMTFIEAAAAQAYDGSHQHERVENTT